jgi:hypothetical protein
MIAIKEGKGDWRCRFELSSGVSSTSSSDSSMSTGGDSAWVTGSGGVTRSLVLDGAGGDGGASATNLLPWGWGLGNAIAGLTTTGDSAGFALGSTGFESVNEFPHFGHVALRPKCSFEARTLP